MSMTGRPRWWRWGRRVTAYYNEIDPACAQWLKNLIKVGLIAPGDVDERDIIDVVPTELAGYTQCHFFAGFGGWSRALRLAGWPDDRPVWTGSCPCQPFSAAGRGGGFTDERHLWPAWFHLIGVYQPTIIFGEQVASKDGLEWFDLVSSDLEGAGYAVGATDLCAAGVGAPHIRQRLWFVAESEYCGCQRWDKKRTGASSTMPSSKDGRMGQSKSKGLQECECHRFASSQEIEAGRDGLRGTGLSLATVANTSFIGGGAGLCDSGPVADGRRTFWANAEWLPCRDGYLRPTKPGVFPLAHGIPGRVAKLRAIGNSIVPQVAAEFIGAYLKA